MAKTLQSFRPHPNLGETVNCNIIQSEIEGGVFLADLPPATVLRIQTQHHDYTAVTLAENLDCLILGVILAYLFSGGVLLYLFGIAIQAAGG